MFGLFKKKSQIDIIIKDLEIKQAIDIVKDYQQFGRRGQSYNFSGEDEYYYIFEGDYDFIKAYLSKDFSILKFEYSGNITNIIDLSQNRDKIKQELQDLFDGLLLQQQSIIKLKKAMKSTLEDLQNNK